jgi:hypothetical protein
MAEITHHGFASQAAAAQRKHVEQLQTKMKFMYEAIDQTPPALVALPPPTCEASMGAFKLHKLTAAYASQVKSPRLPLRDPLAPTSLISRIA